MTGIRRLKHDARWVTNEQRQRADRVNKAETNYAGVEIPKKTVIKLHETFVDGKIPGAEWLKEGILDYFARWGQRPTELVLISRSLTTTICLHCPEITPEGEWPIVALRIVQGEQVEIR